MSEINTWPGWECVRLIGEGGFGKVYEIRRVEFGREYNAALKVITIPQNSSAIEAAYDEGMDDESVTSYFHSIVADITAEFALMSELKGHSNIVSYEDHMVMERKDSIGWDIMIRMELLTPLQTYYRNHTMGEQDVIRLGIGICRALELCQKRNILHRDIKPENIFVSPFGDYKLGDFGIARTVEKTISNLSKKGTYNYMAPEVYRGEAYGASADIYSLAVVLYRYLNGNRLPFLPQGVIRYNDMEQALQRRIAGEPIPEPVYGSKQLKKAVLRALEYDPAKRYLSAFEFRKALENCMKDVEEIMPSVVSDSLPGGENTSLKDPLLSMPTQSMTEIPDVDKTVSVFSSIGETASHEATESPSLALFQECEAENTENTAVEEFLPISASQEISATSENDKTVSVYSGTKETGNITTEENLSMDVQSGQTVSVFGDDEMTAIPVSAEQESSLSNPVLMEETGKIDAIEATVPGTENTVDNDSMTVFRHTKKKKLVIALAAGIVVVVGLFVAVGLLFFMGGNRTNNSEKKDADPENSVVDSTDNIENSMGWRLDDGVLTISENDYIYEYGRPPWYGERGGIERVVIEEGVTSIGKRAFQNFENLISVTIPDSVTSIGAYVFYGCVSLTSVTIPDGVTSIEESAFQGCKNLTSITIPDSVTSIGEYAFFGCESLPLITIPDSVASIGESAFSKCNSLNSVTIPKRVRFIVMSTFSNCESLTSVTISNGVTYVGIRAFSGCKNLTTVTIPDSVAFIDLDAFFGCSSDLTFYCHKRSYAQQYAKDAGIKVQVIN